MAVTVNIPIENAVTDGSLNPVTSNAVFDALAGKLDTNDITQTITDGVTDKAPSEDAVHDALELKADITSIPSNLTLFFTNASSDVPGYLRSVTTISDPDYNDPAVDILSAPITGVNQLVRNHISDPGIISGNPGIITVSLFGLVRKSSGSGSANMYFEVFHRDSLGVETLVATSANSTTLNSPTFEQVLVYAELNNGEWDATDRMVVKTYGNRIAGGSNPTYVTRYGGSNPARTIVPVPASVILDVPIQVGITEIVDGTNGFVLKNTGGVVDEIAIDTTPTDGSTNLIDSNAVFDGLAGKQDTLISGTNIKTINGTTILGSGDLVTSHLGNSDLTSTANTRKFILNGSTNANSFEIWNGTKALFGVGGNGRVGIGTTIIIPTTQMLSVLAETASDTVIRATHSATTGANLGFYSRVIGVGASINTACRLDASGASANYSLWLENGDVNISATAGVKFGVAVSQKLSLWGKTPIVQPTTAITGATLVGGGGANITATDTFGGYTLQQIAAALVNVGILA